MRENPFSIVTGGKPVKFFHYAFIFHLAHITAHLVTHLDSSINHLILPLEMCAQSFSTVNKLLKVTFSNPNSSQQMVKIPLR